MIVSDIDKINYFGLSNPLPYKYIEQCCNGKAKSELDKQYAKLIRTAFNDSAYLSTMFSYFINQIVVGKKVQLNGGLSDKIKIDSGSLMNHIVFYFFNNTKALEKEKAEYVSNIFTALQKVKNQEDYSFTAFDTEKLKIYKTALKSIRSKISSYDNLALLFADFGFLSDISDKISSVNGNGNIFEKNLSALDKYKNNLSEFISQLIVHSKYMVDNANKNNMSININGFDVDKFMFIVFSMKLTYLKDNYSSYNEIYPIFTYLNELSDRDNANLYYYKFDKKSMKCDIKYTYKDFLKEASEYIKSNPQANFDVIPSGFFDGWEEDDVNEFLDMYTDDSDKNFEVVDPEYIFLPSGERENNNARVNSNTSKNISRDNMQLAIEKRSFYDKNRDKIHTMLLGKNKFSGYVANILNNGYVIFEKYDITNGCLSNKAGAAYIMNIDNFNSLSSRSIQDLRKIVSTQPDDMPVYQKVNYVCHRGNWQERIQAYFDQYTGIKKEDIDRVVVNSADRAGRNIPDDKNNIYKKQI